MKKTQLTKEGLMVLEAELEELKSRKRPSLVERLANARRDGDLSENNDYQSAREELEFLDGRIAELAEVIKNAQIVVKNGRKGVVEVGTKVMVKIGATKAEYSIVGEWEADPVAKKISLTSPLGLALAGKKAGDKVQVAAPAGRIVYEIVSVS